MSNQEILQKAIQKAIDNGYQLGPIDADYGQWLIDENREYEIIFSHDFAKAFWGKEHEVGVSEEIEVEPRFQYKYIPAWQWHLQQMVLEEEPIKYLERFI